MAEKPIRGGMVPLEDVEDDAIWDRVWDGIRQEREDARKQAEVAPAPLADDMQERAALMADIIGGLVPNADELL